MFLESIKFYEHVEVHLKFNSMETPRLTMITTYTNVTYHEYQGMLYQGTLFLTNIKVRFFLKN